MLSGIGTARRRIGPALGATELPALPRTFWYAAVGGLLAAAALIGAILLEDGAKLAIAVPACIASTLLALRLPAVAMILLLALTGIVGTILAFTDLSPRYLIDVSLAGLVAATLWRLSIERGQGTAWLPLAVIAVVAYLVASFGQALLSPSISAAQTAFRSTAWQVALVPAIALAGWSLATRRRIVRRLSRPGLPIAGYAVLRLAVGPAEAEREVALALAPANILPSGEVGLYGSMLSRHQLAAWCGIALPFATAIALACERRPAPHPACGSGAQRDRPDRHADPRRLRRRHGGAGGRARPLRHGPRLPRAAPPRGAAAGGDGPGRRGGRVPGGRDRHRARRRSTSPGDTRRWPLRPRTPGSPPDSRSGTT